MNIFNRVIKHQTPESVELEFTLAGIGNRAWALLIDYHVLAFLIVALLISLNIISIQVVNILVGFSEADDIKIWSAAIQLLVTYFIYTGYFVYFETRWQGQTPGKRFAKIRVIQDNGRPIGLQQATLRSLLRVVDDILFLGAVLIALSPKEKRVGDWVAGTIVIQAPSVAAATFPVSEQANDLAKQLVKADLSQLLPDDFAVIREYLQRRKVMAPKARAQLSLQLAQQVKSIIALQKLSTPVTPDVFLEAVYLAYQYHKF